MGPESEEKKEMLIIDGNAFYEIDMECVREKEQKKRRMQKPGRQQKTISERQRS